MEPAELHFPKAAPRPRGRSLLVLIAAATDPRPREIGTDADAAARIAALEAEVSRLREALAFHRARAAAPIREHCAGDALMARLRAAADAAGTRAPLPEAARRRAAVRRGDQIPTIR